MGGTKADAPSAGTKKCVVVVKKGGSAPAQKTNSFNNNRKENVKQYSGSDDGMSYNPFAALLKK